MKQEYRRQPHGTGPTIVLETHGLIRPMRQEMETALNMASMLPREELASFLGDLERIRVTALARLIAPAPIEHSSDELLGVAETARRLGVSRNYLYHNHRHFPFVRRIGRSLRFSAQGVTKYIQRASVRHDG